MGQKTHPTGFRLGIVKTWSSKWYAKRDFRKFLHEDLRLRKYIKAKLQHAGIAKIDIERAANKVRITICTARPGIIIGKKSSEIEKLKGELQNMTDKEVYINITEVQRPETDSHRSPSAIPAACLSATCRAARTFWSRPGSLASSSRPICRS